MKLLTHFQTSKVLTTFNHAGGSLNLCKLQHQEYPNTPVFSIFLLWAACSFRYFKFFSIVMTHLSYCKRSHLKGVVAAQLQWHLPNMNVIKKNQILAMSHNIWGPDMISRGQHHKSGPQHNYLATPHLPPTPITSQGPHISGSRHDKWGTQNSRGSHIIILGPGHTKSGSSHDKVGAQHNYLGASK